MSPDLLAGDIGVPQSLNRYSYVQNDPINAGDPTGLDTAWLCWGSKEPPGLYQTCIQIDIPPPDSPQDSGSWGDWVTFGAGGGRFGSPSFVLLGPSFGG